MASAGSIILAIVIFIGSGVCEIGGGWFVWKWRRDGWNIAFLFIGAVLLTLYGILPTLQDAPFGRTYAAYGGFFIILALLWAWLFEGAKPDIWDAVGSAIAVAGACLIFFGPRSSAPAPIQVVEVPAPAPALALPGAPAPPPELQVVTHPPPPVSPPPGFTGTPPGSPGASKVTAMNDMGQPAGPTEELNGSVGPAGSSAGATQSEANSGLSPVEAVNGRGHVP